MKFVTFALITALLINAGYLALNIFRDLAERRRLSAAIGLLSLSGVFSLFAFQIYFTLKSSTDL